MDPFTLAYLAGHSDISITKRYIHPEDETVKAAMERVAEKLGTPYNIPYSATNEENTSAATSAAITAHPIRF